MAVLAIFTYEIQPGRLGDFLAKLGLAASPRFASPVMPRSVRLYRSPVLGPDTGPMLLFLEYDDMASYEARTAWEQSNREWCSLFAASVNSPERLVSVQLLTEYTPA